MATNTINLPQGFVLDKNAQPNLPQGFIIDKQPQQFGRITAEPVDPEETRQIKQLEFLQQGLQSGQIQPTDPTFFQRLKADLPQITGGTAGALAFERAARPLTQQIPHPLGQAGARLGAVVLGAFIGGAGGKGFQQTFRMAQPGAKAMTLGDIFTEQAIAGIEEAGSELVGRGLAKGAGAIIRPIGRRIITPGAREAAKLLRKSGLGITLAQATDNRLIDLMESIAEGSLLGGGRLQKLRLIKIPAAITKAVGDLSDDFAKSMGRLSGEDVGELLLDTINKKNTAFKRASRSIYTQVDKLVKRSGQIGDIVDVSALKKFAQGRLQAKVRVLRSATGDTLLDSIVNLPDRITFKQASSLRSALLTQTRNMSVTKDVALGITKQLSKMSDNAIDKAGRRLAPEALAMKRFADKFHRQGKEIFNSKIIKSLSRTLADNPEKAVPRIFQKGASKQIRLIRNTVGPETWDALKHGYLETLIAQSKNADGNFIAKSFLNKLDDPILKSAFTESEIASIKNLGKAVSVLQKPTAQFGATGKLVIAISQAGILTGGAFAQRPGQAAAIVFSPIAFARITTNKKWSKLLIEGMKDPIKRSVALIRLARIATNIDLDTAKKRQKQIKEPTLRQLRGFGEGF